MIWILVGVLAGAILGAGAAFAARRFTRTDSRVKAWWGSVLGVIAGGIVGSLNDSALAGTAPAAAVLCGAALLVLLALTAVLVDQAEMRLPDVLTYPLAFVSVVILGVLQWIGADGSIVGGLIGGAAWGLWMLLGALLIPRGFGLGDVKLVVGLGIWLGWVSWLTLAAGIMLGQVFISVVLIAGRRRSRAAGGESPLGPALLLGALVALLIPIG